MPRRDAGPPGPLRRGGRAHPPRRPRDAGRRARVRSTRRARPRTPPRSPPSRTSGRRGRASPPGTGRRTPPMSERPRRYSRRAPRAIAANAASSSTCHSHQLACQFRLSDTAIIASASKHARHGHAQRHGVTTAPVELDRAPRRIGVQRDRDRGQDAQHARPLERRGRHRSRAVTARSIRRPRRPSEQEATEQHRSQTQDHLGTRSRQRARGSRREHRRDDESDRRGRGEPDVRRPPAARPASRARAGPGTPRWTGTRVRSTRAEHRDTVPRRHS